MTQCYDCGAPCGKRHPTGWQNEHFWCDKCARKHSKNAVQVIIGILFLAFAAVLTAIVACTILKPIASSSGYGTAKGLAIGFGVGGVVLYFVMRSFAGKVDGCLVRMVVKLLGFFAFALGVGMLIVTFLAEDTLKDCLGVKVANDAPVSESTP